MTDSSPIIKMTAWLRTILCCCPDENEDDRPVLQIGHPTNFRREEISLPGLTTSEYPFPAPPSDPTPPLTPPMHREALIRSKSHEDSTKMFATLRPLASAPSGEFAVRPATSKASLAYETSRRPAPVPEKNPPTPPESQESSSMTPSPSLHIVDEPPQIPPLAPSSPVEWVKKHGRAISEELRRSWDYVQGNRREEAVGRHAPRANRETGEGVGLGIGMGTEMELRGLISGQGIEGEGEETSSGEEGEGEISK